jgi:hypothetical protein
VPFRLEVTVYSSSGELVRNVYTGGAQQLQDQVKLSGPTLAVGTQAVYVVFKGLLSNGDDSVAWDGTNNNGQLVGPGQYYFKVESHDAFGKVTTVVAPILVLPTGGQNILQVFNSAGEVVATIYPSMILPPKATVEDFALDSTSFAAAFDPVTGAPLSHMNITLKDNQGNVYTAQWDGKNSQGKPVSSGVYDIQLLSAKGASQTVMSRQVEVLVAASKALGAEVYAAPNPFKPEAGQDAVVSVYYKPMLSGRASAKVYDIAGQQVGRALDGANSGLLQIQAGAWTSGIYFIDFEYTDGNGNLKRKVLRLAVVK